MRNSTFDGKPLAASVSGFSEYTTNSAVTAPVKPAPVLTPTDILAQINELKKIFNKQELDLALKLLSVHIHDTNNPHHTDLNQFTLQIADILYREYVAQGGTGSREAYVQALFKTLRVASMEEMKNGTNDDLLISIKGARKFLSDHEADDEAHHELFEKLFPGDAIKNEPFYSMHAMIGISKYLMELLTVSISEDYDTVPFSYIDANGVLQYCSGNEEIPIDYSHLVPLIPCFGQKINEIRESNNFNSLIDNNISLVTDAEIAPDKSNTAVALFASNDIVPQSHTLILENVFVPMNTPKTFSIFVKPENCRYMAFSFKNMLTDIVSVHAIYDLQEGVCFTVNHMETFTARMFPIGPEWFRCEFSMFHQIGQESNLTITFFNEYTAENEFTFTGKEELLACVWGMQLEESHIASPYIPTNGKPGVRNPIAIKLDLDGMKACSINSAYLNPGICLDPLSQRPLFEITDKDNEKLVNANYTTDGSLVINHWNTLHVGDLVQPTIISSESCYPTVEKICQLTHGFNEEKMLTKYNDGISIESDMYENKPICQTLWIGCDSSGNFLDGYIDHMIIYPIKLTANEATFSNGEEYE